MSAAALAAESHPAGERLSRRVLKVCDAVGEFIEYWGFKRVHGRIWALLAVHDGPLSQAEVSRRLNISRSLVSETMSELAGFGLVRPISSRRNAPYEAVFDVWPTIADVLRSREWMLLEQARTALEAAVAAAEEVEARGEPAEWSLSNLRLLLRMTEVFQGLLRMLIALRRPEGLKDLGKALKGTARLVRSLA